ncbi:hypothetical protein ABQW72_18010 [Xanthomonas hortorum pv. pelargonii]|uniref:hypothetical protein n=1 Tax=Xanthomonas hortorum TaxID=56454 RepID=UPI0032E8C7C8
MNAARLMAVLCMAQLAGCALQPARDPEVTQLRLDVTQLTSQVADLERKGKPETPPPPACYLNGQPYSEGAVVAGRICGTGTMVYKDGQRTPLEWLPHRTN